MRAEKGFSILEVLIGVSLFAVGLIGVTGLFISTVKGNSLSGNVSDATFLASNILEELMTAPYDPALDPQNRLLDDGDSPGGLDDNTAATADGSRLGIGRNNKFNVYWNIAVDEPLLNSKQIRIIVEWSVKGQSRQLVFNSIRSRVI